MGTAPIRLIRLCAVFALFLSFAHFLVALADWAAPMGPSNGWWVGKRVKDVILPNQPIPARPVAPVPDATASRLTDFARYEMRTLCTALMGPSTWFCLAGILYLFAGHQLRATRQSSDTEG